MTIRSALIATGATFEILGIALVAAGDLVPGARRLSHWVASRVSRLRRWFARTVLRRPGSITHQVSVGGAITPGGQVSMIVSTDPEGALEAKVEFLLREAHRAQERLNSLERDVGTVRDESASRDAAIRAELAIHAGTAIRDAIERYGRERTLGVLCLGIALILWTLSAFVS